MLGATVLAAALVTTAAVGVDRGKSGTDFHVAGDGSLPSERPELRASRAPLSTEETGYALQLASGAPELAGATDVQGRPGPQPLYVDLPPLAESTHGHRQAVVMVYDYTAGRAVQLLVDLRAGAVVSAESDPELRPPLARDEADAAMEIALGSSVRPAFRAQFESVQGIPVLSPAQVGYAAGVWADNATTAGAQACATHRCARLLVSLPSGDYLDTTDFVVDLTAGSVVLLQ